MEITEEGKFDFAAMGESSSLLDLVAKTSNRENAD